MSESLFLKFNRSSLDDRQIDTLIGLSKAFIADNEVNQQEAEVLHSWLQQARSLTDHPVINNVWKHLNAILSDDVLDQGEALDLFSVLTKIAGGEVELGEVGKSSTLPLDEPAPEIVFPFRQFLFTGTCAFGTRKQCQAATEDLGGILAKGVTKTVNYLVIGTYVTDSWKHETFGRKIEKAMTYRERGVPLAIISEEHWINSGNISLPDR